MWGVVARFSWSLVGVMWGTEIHSVSSCAG